jgi:amidophosphoribosyltransferase
VCGILGLLLHDPSLDAAPDISEGLSLLQHRGQDACGIVTCGTKGRFFQCKANGMVRDVFDEKAISKLIGGMGVGHGKPSGVNQSSLQSSDIVRRSSLSNCWKLKSR